MPPFLSVKLVANRFKGFEREAIRKADHYDAALAIAQPHNIKDLDDACRQFMVDNFTKTWRPDKTHNDVLQYRLGRVGDQEKRAGLWCLCKMIQYVKGSEWDAVKACSRLAEETVYGRPYRFPEVQDPGPKHLQTLCGLVLAVGADPSEPHLLFHAVKEFTTQRFLAEKMGYLAPVEKHIAYNQARSEELKKALFSLPAPPIPRSVLCTPTPATSSETSPGSSPTTNALPPPTPGTDGGPTARSSSMPGGKSTSS